MSSWLPPSSNASFNASFVCHGKYYLHIQGIGLMTITDTGRGSDLGLMGGPDLQSNLVSGQLNLVNLVPGGERLANFKICLLEPYDTQRLLIGTRANGFFLYDGVQIVPFPTAADKYLLENQLYHGIRLKFSPGQFALATLMGGLVIIDDQGHLKNIFSRNNTLPDNKVWYVYEDLQGNLWAALNTGITRIEYTSPFTFYDQRCGLPGLVLSVISYGQKKTTISGYHRWTIYTRLYRAIPNDTGHDQRLLGLEGGRSFPIDRFQQWHFSNF